MTVARLLHAIFFFAVDNIRFCVRSRKTNGVWPTEVDFVYLWVDGADPNHQKKKNAFIKKSTASYTIESKAVMKYRWANHNEILHSLRSVSLYCPWVHKIWIITDAQRFDITALPPAIAKKIVFLDHTDIFRDHTLALPSFNSRSIETLIWRIDGLSEHFVYFNDDMFVLRPTAIGHFFQGSQPILRGSIRRPFGSYPNSLHQQGMINSKKLLGEDGKTFFRTAHVPYPMVKSDLERLCETYHEEIKKNVSFRFRTREQFKIVSLLYEDYIAKKQYASLCRKDYSHISEEGCRSFSRKKIVRLLRRKSSRFLCINDVGSLSRTVPDYQRFLV